MRCSRSKCFPAQRGDCLWLTYGKRGDLHHVLVDAGPQETIPTLMPVLEERICRLDGTTSRVELLVVSHVDADHIQGVVSLLSDHRRVRLFNDVWFNGYRHLTGLLGGPDGERLTAALNTQPKRWNKAFRGGAVVISDDGPLPTVTLNGGLEITLLAPDRAALTRLIPQWEKTCQKAGILPGQGATIARRSWQRDELLGFNPDILAKRKYTRGHQQAQCHEHRVHRQVRQQAGAAAGRRADRGGDRRFAAPGWPASLLGGEAVASWFAAQHQSGAVQADLVQTVASLHQRRRLRASRPREPARTNRDNAGQA